MALAAAFLRSLAFSALPFLAFALAALRVVLNLDDSSSWGWEQWLQLEFPVVSSALTLAGTIFNEALFLGIFNIGFLWPLTYFSSSWMFISWIPEVALFIANFFIYWYEQDDTLEGYWNTLLEIGTGALLSLFAVPLDLALLASGSVLVFTNDLSISKFFQPWKILEPVVLVSASAGAIFLSCLGYLFSFAVNPYFIFDTEDEWWIITVLQSIFNPGITIGSLISGWAIRDTSRVQVYYAPLERKVPGWNDEETADRMAELGFEIPDQFSTFILNCTSLAQVGLAVLITGLVLVVVNEGNRVVLDGPGLPLGLQNTGSFDTMLGWVVEMAKSLASLSAISLPIIWMLLERHS